jgi:hypothetical protein
MPRPQFTLRALLVAMLVVGAFFGGFLAGADWQKRSHKEASRPTILATETSTLQGADGITNVYVKEIWSDGSVTWRRSTVPP